MAGQTYSHVSWTRKKRPEEMVSNPVSEIGPACYIQDEGQLGFEASGHISGHWDSLKADPA